MIEFVVGAACGVLLVYSVTSFIVIRNNAKAIRLLREANDITTVAFETVKKAYDTSLENYIDLLVCIKNGDIDAETVSVLLDNALLGQTRLEMLEE